MTFQKSDQSFCYQWGRFGELVWWIALLQPVLLWAAFLARAFVGSKAQSIYYRIQAGSLFLTWGLFYVLRDGVFRSPVPHPSCTSARFSRPAFEVTIMAHYFVAIYLRDRYFGWAYGAWNWLWVAMIFLFVYGGASVTGNYVQLDLVVGLGYGALMGLVSGYVIYVHLVPVLPLFYGYWYLWWDWQGGLRATTIQERDAYSLHLDKLRASEPRAEEWA